MVSWVFWTMYGLIGYTMVTTTMLFGFRRAIRFSFELWRGRKSLVFFKRGNIITDYKVIKKEPSLGLGDGDKTYKIDERKGLRFKRLSVHVFEEDNIAELDFADKKLMYPPFQFDPVVFQKAIQRALASGVNDEDQTWKKIAIIALIIIAVATIGSLYFGYQNYELVRDYLTQSGVLKL